MFSTQRTPQWHTDRRGKVTASVCGTIIGVNKHQSAESMWKEQVGINKPFKGNFFTEYGTNNEPNALNEYSIQTGNHVEEVGFVVHPRYKWLGGSPDGLVHSDGVVEFKCPWPKAKNMYTTDTLPLHYFVQCQVLMEVTNRAWCDLFVWTPDESRRWRFNRDPCFFALICPVLASYHAKITLRDPTGDAPPTLDTVSKKMQHAFVHKVLLDCLVAPNHETTRLFSEKEGGTWKTTDKGDSKRCKLSASPSQQEQP
jgi:putative phage-type endonuclease